MKPSLGGGFSVAHSQNGSRYSRGREGGRRRRRGVIKKITQGEKGGEKNQSE